MKTISFKTHVGEDGTLQISLPPELKNTDLEVTLVYQPISLKEKEEKTTFSQWQEGFFEEVIGKKKKLHLANGKKAFLKK